ncbi:MAG TPA: AbrB/MazE/SpoVT family DNA-binding domain-containing protein [Candidatus Saccharimonadales bacterium]|jgi:AbrB family looped-hinge helix DNA binding protein
MIGNMNYTYSITSKGQITIPKEYRDKLGLDEFNKATLEINDRDEIVITKPKDLREVRALLNRPTFKDKLSEREQIIGRELAKKYGVS